MTCINSLCLPHLNLTTLPDTVAGVMQCIRANRLFVLDSFDVDFRPKENM